MRFRKNILLLMVVGIIVALLVGCQPQQSTEEARIEGLDGQMTIQTVSGESDCSLCHEAEGRSQVDLDTLTGLHATTATCTDCHAFDSVLEGEHVDVSVDDKAPTRLRKTKVNEETCLSCHGSRDALKEKTSAVVTLTDTNGLVVNPHDLPAGSGHESITCADCHDGHKEVADEKELCITCHHKGVFECNTCHGVS